MTLINNMAKDSFIFYRDWLAGLQNLDPKLRYELLDAIISFGLDGKETELTPVASAIFGFIRPQIERAVNKYEQICQRNRENGKKGGRPVKTQNNPKNPVGYLETQQNPKNPEKPKKPYNDNDNDNDNDNIKKDKNKFLSKKRNFQPPTISEVSMYCDERNNGIDPEAFINFYESKGWMIGKNKMKDWKAAIRTWEKKQINLITQNQNGNITNDDRRKLEKSKRDAETIALLNHLSETNEPAIEFAE